MSLSCKRLKQEAGTRCCDKMQRMGQEDAVSVSAEAVGALMVQYDKHLHMVDFSLLLVEIVEMDGECKCFTSCTFVLGKIL